MAKSQSTTDQTDSQLLAILEGRTCPSGSCDGDLERGTYKDNQAVVCEDCGTPQAQVWTPSS
ncbi:HVO_A0556 family zinc finger protein [Natronolimnobius baerhuensis]|uniref:Uncharacterized protein n=1 Tax=Natronolimnobius baerhuensis TaxID=253108 RepID=A0A202E9D1_9EURY|nr:HVO_A0556 family zinc finger protein [Natronolimnobius baerhuensis]OVE84875.1 hypothetical protein B2G88_10920 [Natronolimnobius baerhuensis]